MPDIRLVRTFLEPRHGQLAERAERFAMEEIARRSGPADDAGARTEARALLGLLGAGGWLQPILDLDLRGCCLMREALGEASPLADAVFSLVYSLDKSYDFAARRPLWFCSNRVCSCCYSGS